MANLYCLIRHTIRRHITTIMLTALVGFITSTPYAHSMFPGNAHQYPDVSELNINSYVPRVSSATHMRVTGSVGDLLVSDDWLSQTLIKNSTQLSSEFLLEMLRRAEGGKLAKSITRILEQRGHTIAMQVDEAPNKKRSNRDELSDQKNKRHKGTVQ